MKTKSNHRSAFTLIEMLVVIAIIGILAAAVFKLMGLAQNKAAVAETKTMLAQIGYALNEYRAEYGIYPPVTKVYYEHENAKEQTDWFRNNYLPNNNDFAEPKLFEFGLVAHLWERYDPGRHSGIIVHKDNELWVDDTARDERAKKNWGHFLKDVHVSGRLLDEYEGPAGLNAPFRNTRSTLLDSWLQELHYESHPPYQSCKLWSNGPTGDSRDDISWTSLSD